MAKTVFGFVVAALILLSALAHGLLGWPELSKELGTLDADTRGALAVAWHFGTSSMAAFAAIVALGTWRHRRGRGAPSGVFAIVAAAYLVFGVAAFVARDFNPFFFLFMGTGAAVAVLGWWTRKASAT